MNQADPPPSPRSRLQTVGLVLRWCLRVLMAGTAFVVLLSWLGRLHWSLALLEHLSFHTSCLAFVGCILSVLLRDTRMAWVCIAVSTIAFLHFAPRSPANNISNPDSTLTLLHINLGRNAADHNSLVMLLNGSANRLPDLVCLQEFTPEREIALRQELSGYRWLESVPREDSRGVAMLLRIDAVHLEEIDTRVLQWLPGEQDRPTIECRLEWSGSETTILSLHTKRPVRAMNALIQQRELSAAADHVKIRTDVMKKVVVLGDFNSTSAGHVYRDFLKKAKLRPSSNRIATGGTFPASWPKFFQFDIDLCAVSSTIVVNAVEAGESFGSDHRPLWVVLGK